MHTEEIHFNNGAIKLAGTLFLPVEPASCPALTVLHAAAGGERGYHFYEHLAELPPAMGVAVLLYDRRGSGESQGVFETADFADLAADGSAAVDYLLSRSEIDPESVGIYGISQGGWIAPLIAANRPEVAFQVIVSGCGVTPAEQMDYSAAYTLQEAGYSEQVLSRALALRASTNAYYRGEMRRAELVAELREVAEESWYPRAYLDAPGAIPEDVRASKWFYEMDHDPLPVWQEVHCPTLFLYADDDRWVPVAESMRRHKLACAHLPEVRFECIPGSDHLMHELGSEDPKRIAAGYLDVLSHWLSEQLLVDG